jgi:hypothetical protein
MTLAATVCIIPANAWLVYNNVLLIPSILLLLQERSTSGAGRALQSLAGSALCLAMFGTPAWALLALTHPRLPPLPPFLLNYLLAIPIAVALLCINLTASNQAESLGLAG